MSPPSPPPAPPLLVLLNGPPGAGKSTLAAELARRHPHLHPLDVDLVKHALPTWPSSPQAAGLRARELILGRARAHLGAGEGVVIGQYLARPEFPARLAELTQQVSARFVHVVLVLPADLLERRLRERRRSPTRPEQAVNDEGVDPAAAAALIASVEQATGRREDLVRVEASGDLAATTARLEDALGLP